MKQFRQNSDEIYMIENIACTALYSICQTSNICISVPPQVSILKADNKAQFTSKNNMKRQNTHLESMVCYSFLTSKNLYNFTIASNIP